MDRHEATPVTVRAARHDDESQWRALWQAYCDFYQVSFARNVTDTLWTRIMTPDVPIHALVAETKRSASAQIVGIANYVLHPYTWGTEPICYLEDLFVAEEARGQGAGAALINALIALGQTNRWQRVYWNTHEANTTARALYDQFTPVDPFVRYVVKLPPVG